MIITIGEWFNPTRAIGVAAYGIAVTSCAIAWIRTKAAHSAWRLAALLTVIESALLLDMVFNLRWKLHQAFMDLAMRTHEYDLRRLPQLVLVMLLGAILLLSVIAARSFFRDSVGALLAVSGVLLSLALWCVEVVSLHALDRIFYHPLNILNSPRGSLMAVSFLWILACLMTSVGILISPVKAKFGR